MCLHDEYLDVYESQQQKLDQILRDFWSKSSVK
jgi:hypothetical protein